MTHATDPRRVTLYTWIISVGGFLFGYDTGIINGALPFLTRSSCPSSSRTSPCRLRRRGWRRPR